MLQGREAEPRIPNTFEGPRQRFLATFVVVVFLVAACGPLGGPARNLIPSKA